MEGLFITTVIIRVYFLHVRERDDAISTVYTDNERYDCS